MSPSRAKVAPTAAAAIAAGVLVAFLPSGAAGAATASGPTVRPAAKAPVTVTLEFSASRARVGTKVDFDVAVQPLPTSVAYYKVTIQYKDGGSWRRLGRLKLGRDGTVDGWVSKETPAVRRYRAIMPETSDTLRGVSRTARIVWVR